MCVFGGVGVHVYGMWPKIDLFSGSKNPAVYVYYTTCSWNFNSSKVVFYIQWVVQMEKLMWLFY